MGCKIHLHIEIKINDTWEHYSCPYMPRDYNLYGKMAGVRDENVTPISLPKGLPDDITLITKIDFSTNNYHHASWFNIEEIKQLEDWFNQRAERIFESGDINIYRGKIIYGWFDELFGYLFGNGYYKQKGSNIKIEDVRFVFRFDH